MTEIPRDRQAWGRLEGGLEDQVPFEATVTMHPDRIQVREPVHLSFVISPVRAPLGPPE